MMERIVSALRRGFAESFQELADTVIRCDSGRWSRGHEEPYLAPGRLANHAVEVASSLICPLGRSLPVNATEQEPSRTVVAERVGLIGRSVDRWFRRHEPAELLTEEQGSRSFASKLERACLTLRLLDDHLGRLRRHAHQPIPRVSQSPSELDAAGV